VKTAVIRKGDLARRIRRDDIPVEINKMSRAFYTVRIMTDGAWRPPDRNMSFMLGETPVSQDVISIMAFIT